MYIYVICMFYICYMYVLCMYVNIIVCSLYAGAGTPTYMAPEQMRGKHYSEKVDVYSVGVVLCACVV